MIYEKLLRLPLFTGMSLDELQRIVTKAKLDFGKVAEGHVVVRRGETCSRLLIVIDGEVESEAIAENGSYTVTETLHAPVIIQQECIFGRFQDFTRTVTAKTQVNTITLDKSEIQALVSKSVIFRLNLFGSFSTFIQKKEQELFRPYPSSLENRIISFFRQRCLTPAGEKIFKIKMTTLADIFNTNRIEVSHALNALQDRKYVVLSRGKVVIPDLHALITVK